MLADGFVEFGASGTVYNRATIINLLLQENDSGNDDLKTTNYAMTTISDDAVLLTYDSERNQTDGAKRHVLRSSIWKRNEDRWQMLFHQGTLNGANCRVEIEIMVALQARWRCLDYLFDEIDFADENDSFYSTSYRGVEHGPVQQLRPDDRDDDPFECGPLSLVDADRPAVGDRHAASRFYIAANLLD